MIQNAALFLALRYLRPQRSFVSVITVISVLGIAVGVLMMIVVRAVMMGFEADFRDTLMGAKPHILFRQTTTGDSRPWPDVLPWLKKSDQVRSATAYAGGLLFLSQEDQQTPAQVIGIPPEEAPVHLRKTSTHLLAGSLELTDGGIVISDQHAQSLNLRLGDEFSVYASQNVNDAVRKYSEANDQNSEVEKKAILDQIRLNPQKLKLTGVLNSETAGFLAYTTLNTAQTLFHLDAGITGIALEIPDPKNAEIVAKSLSAEMPGWQAELWSDDSSARLAAMGNEQTMMQFVLSIIALVAAFSVMNTTITITTQKRREIGVLAALGGRPSQLVNIFLLQAVIVGVLGTGLGLVSSLVVLWLRNDLRDLLTTLAGGQVHAVDGVFLSSIPAYLQPGDVILTCTTSILLCILAGFLPAWIAARVDPAVALRD